jgi:hypothetical protein
MRYLTLFLSVTIIWLASAELAVAGTAAALMKTREGSLVLEGKEKRTKASAPAKKDTLHTMLSREVQVYIFRGTTRVWPRPYVLGQTRFYQPVGRYRRLAGPYLESLIQKYGNHYGVDPSLVRAVMRHESGFNPHAVSPKGAQGLMQLMPGTASLMGVNNPFDPEQNVAGGVGYLRHCLDRFGHNVPMAVAAYNAGPARVAKSNGVPAIPETQAFVKNVLGTYTGRSPGPLPQAKSPDQPKAKMATSNSSDKSLDQRILPASPRPVSANAEGNPVALRPQAKVIVVRYPKSKRVAEAKPKGAD